MAWEGHQYCPEGLLAAEDLSANQFREVYMDDNGAITATSTTNPFIGIQQDKPSAAGQPVKVAVFGMTKVRRDLGAVSSVFVPTGASPAVEVGIVITTTGAATEVGTVLLGVRGQAPEVG